MPKQPRQDMREVLDSLGIKWRTAEKLRRLHRLAHQNLNAISQVATHLASLTAADVLPEVTADPWLSFLLQTVVETLMFPDSLEPDERALTALADIWRRYLTHLREFKLTGVQAVKAADLWSIREAMKAAWFTEIADMEAGTEIGPVCVDSAHRAAIRASQDLLLAYPYFRDRASRDPTPHPEMWGEFLWRWANPLLRDQCERAKSLLSRELEETWDLCGFDQPGSALSTTAFAPLTGSTVVVYNQILVPNGGDRMTGAPPAALLPGNAVAVPAPPVDFSGSPTAAAASTPTRPTAGSNGNGQEEQDEEPQPPALTSAERRVLLTLADMDAAVLASNAQIAAAMDAKVRLSERTIGPAVKKLVGLDLAERPEGERQGARLTLKGRRQARQIAD